MPENKTLVKPICYCEKYTIGLEVEVNATTSF